MKNRKLQFKVTAKTMMIMLLLGVACMTNGYAQTIIVGNLKYTISDDDDYAKVVGHVDGMSASGEVVIPETIIYDYDTYSVKRIGNQAFKNCVGLTSFVFSESIIEIGSNAFLGTGWYNNQSDGVLYLNNCCVGYKGSQPTDTLNLQTGTRLICNSAFYGCNGITGDLIIPNSITRIGQYAFKNCTGFNGTLTIGTAVNRIETEAFANTGFTTVNFNPTNCTKMGYYREDGDWYGSPVFKDCPSITTLTIGENVTNIPTYAFENCSGLVGNLIIPNSVTSIGYGAFYGCSGYDGILTIGTSVTYIGGEAFFYCRDFTEVQFNATSCSDGREGTDVFSYNLNNTSLTIGDNVLRIPSFIFGSTHFTGNLVIPNSVKMIGNWAFSGCTNFSGTLTIGTSVQSMGYLAFARCGFDEIRYNATSCSDITPIYNYLGHRPPFEDCNASLVIGESVTRIPSNMFIEGTFTSATIHTNTPPSLGQSALVKTIPVYVPSCLVEEYQNSSYWNSFTNIQGIATYPFCFNEDGDWSDASNWDGNQLPGVEDGVIISANCEINSNEEVSSLRVLSDKELTLKSNHTLTVNGRFSNSGGSSALILEDSAQLIHNSVNVQATVKKTITGYGTSEDKWYFITNPITDSIIPSADNGLLSGNYDLYYCYPTSADRLEWRNYKSGAFSLHNGEGYLYANEMGTELSFGGTLAPSNSNVMKTVYYEEGNNRPGNGWTLLGNPFSCNCYLVDAEDNPLTIYKMNADGAGLVEVLSGPIAPMEGFFYYTAETRNVYFSRTAPAGFVP